MPIPKRFTPEVQQQVFDAYEQADRQSKGLGRRFNTKQDTINAILNNFGVDVARNRNKFSAETEAEIAKRYADGELPKELAQEYGCAPYTVRAIARRHGVTINPRGKRHRSFTDNEVAEMARMWQEGMSQAAIGRKFGAHQVIVSRVLKGAGYVPKPRQQVGDSHGLWRGGRTVSGDGYVLVWVPPDHRFADMRTRVGYIPEHRLVMAEALGRPLERSETVHHKNGDRQDNRLANLQLRQGKHGNGIVMRCKDCGSHNVEAAPISED